MYQAALILEGGGMRGLYTAGILDYFIERDVRFAKVYGVSAGCLNGANYVAGQKGRSLSTFTDYLGDERYSSMKNLVKTGNMYDIDFVYNQIPNRLNPYDYEAFENSGTDFYAVVSNIVTGKAEYQLCKNMRLDMNYVRASASLPLLAKPVVIKGKRYLDGGICDSIPLYKSVSDDNEKNVVILTQHKGFVKQPNNEMGMNKLTYRHYPKFITALEIRHLMYNNETAYVEKQEKAGKAFVIQPAAPLAVSRLEKDADKLKALHTQGYEDGKLYYDKMIEYLEK